MRGEKSVIINARGVGDDFVSTSVANGLCTRNNGLRAQTWKWLSTIAVSQATIRVPISRREMSSEKAGERHGLKHDPRDGVSIKTQLTNRAFFFSLRQNCILKRSIYLLPKVPLTILYFYKTDNELVLQSTLRKGASLFQKSVILQDWP